MFFVHISIIRWDDNHLLFDVVMRVKTTHTPHLDNTTSTDLENPEKTCDECVDILLPTHRKLVGQGASGTH